MNQVEIFLVRKLLQRGSFRSVTDLKQKVWDFIDYYTGPWQSPSNGGAGRMKRQPVLVQV